MNSVQPSLCPLVAELQVPIFRQAKLTDTRRKARRAALEAVVSRHYASIYRFVLYLSANGADAEELTQETFAQAWAAIDSFNSRASISTWLHRIAYRKFIDYHRKRQRNHAIIDSLKQQKNAACGHCDPLQSLVRNEDVNALYLQLRRLHDHEIAVIALHYIQGLSFRQMAKVLDVPVGTAKWQTSRALKKLRHLLIGRIEQ